MVSGVVLRSNKVSLKETGDRFEAGFPFGDAFFP